MQSNSPKFSVNGIDLYKVWKGILLGLAGVGITVLTMVMGANFHVVIGGMDFSSIVMLGYSTLCSALVHLLQKYVTDHQV